MIEQIKIETRGKKERGGEEEVFIDPKGREYKAKLIPSNKKEGAWLVTTDKGKKLTLSEDQWDDYILEKGLTVKTNGHSIDTDPETMEVQPEPEPVEAIDIPEVVTEEPVAASKKPRPKKSINNDNTDGILNKEVPHDLVNSKRNRSTRLGDTSAEISNGRVKLKDSPEQAEQQERWEKKRDEILDNLDTRKPTEVPLNLKQGQVIWNDRGEEVIVLDIVTNPKNEAEDLMDGYAVLLFPPQKGRNRGSVEEKVSFSDLEKGKNKIFFTEQIPFIEIDEEAEKEVEPELMVLVAKNHHDGKSSGFLHKSVSLKELNEWNNREGAIAPGEKVGVKRTKTKKVEGGWEVVGSWFSSEDDKKKELYDDYIKTRKERRVKQQQESTAFADLVDEQEPPPLPAEYLEKVRAEKSLAEGRRLAQLREEISHGDLGADLAQHWTPVDVEMPKRESAPLSKFAKKTVKKPWWQRLLGL